MNPDLHMADELKNTDAGNHFVVFGEPDIEIKPVGNDQVGVKVSPSPGQVRREVVSAAAC
jgi:adenine-specific DNA-methyltransferase